MIVPSITGLSALQGNVAFEVAQMPARTPVEVYVAARREVLKAAVEAEVHVVEVEEAVPVEAAVDAVSGLRFQRQIKHLRGMEE